MLERSEICAMIPHDGDMCLLDRVVDWNADVIHCQADSHLSTSNPLRENAQLAALHAIEYGAQAMAVHGALLARRDGLAVAPGFLAAIREAKLYRSRLDDLDATLDVHASQLMASGGNLMYLVRLESAAQAVAEARLTVITQTPREEAPI